MGQSESYIVLASSSTKKNQKGSKLIQKLSCQDCISLQQVQMSSSRGFNIDIQNIQMHAERNKKDIEEYYNYQIEIIRSSQSDFILLSKQEIINKIIKAFSQYGRKRFIYTGYGLNNGDMWIQTKQKPEGEVFKFQELLQLWRKHKHPKSWILMYFDSSFSGHIVCKYYELCQPYDQIKCIYSSSGPEYKCLDLYRYGGLLINSIFNAKQQLRRLFQERKPVIFLNYKHGQYKQIRLLKFFIDQKQSQYPIQLEGSLIMGEEIKGIQLEECTIF